MGGMGLEIWAAAIGQASWQGSLAFLLVWAIHRLVPSLPATIRCWLWRFAFLKVLLVLLGPASVNLPLLPAERISAAAPAAMAAPRPPVSTTAEPSLTAPDPVPPRARPFSSPDGWPAIAFAAWLLGVSFCLVRLFGQWKRLEQLQRACDEVRDGELLLLRGELCRALSLRYKPPIRVTESIERPMLVGTFRPQLILPLAVLRDSGRDEQRLILAHELGHLRRHDIAWGWLPAAVCTLFFFHPLVWLAAVEWRQAHELACDELTLRTTDATPAEYGRLLLQLSARPALSQVGMLPSAGMVGTYASLKRRLTALRPPVPETRQCRCVVSAGLGVLALLALVPWRAVASPLSFLDLNGVANQEMDRGMGSDKLTGNNLAALPRGEQSFAGLRFRVEDRCIQLGSALLSERRRWVEPIPVGRRFTRLAVLHGTMWGGGAPGKLQHVPDGTPIAEYRVHYADGDMATIPVVYGEHLRDWWVPADPPVPRAAVAWTGRNGANTEPGIRLYAMTWTNPRPGVTVKYLEFISLGTGAAPFCVAVTCGD